MSRVRPRCCARRKCPSRRCSRISINPARIFFKRAHLIGVGSVRRDQLEDAVRLVAAGKVHPRVAKVLPLDAAVEAHALVESGTVIGRVVLQP